MAYETITFDATDRIATITLNRPDSYNALTIQMYAEIRDALKKISRDPNIRVVVLTGSGKGFCSGADLLEVQSDDETMDIGEVLRSGLHHVILGIRRLEKPVICAINGVAAGAGTSLALACDFRIASDQASFVFAAFVNIGLIPDAGSTHFLPELVGPAKAFELAMLADSQNRLSAKDALELGIVTRVVAHDDLQKESDLLAEKMSKMATKAIGLAKRAIYRSSERSLEEQLEAEAQLQTVASNTKDFAEGVAAFREKRAADFRGE